MNILNKTDGNNRLHLIFIGKGSFSCISNLTKCFEIIFALGIYTAYVTFSINRKRTLDLNDGIIILTNQ